MVEGDTSTPGQVNRQTKLELWSTQIGDGVVGGTETSRIYICWISNWVSLSSLTNCEIGKSLKVLLEDLIASV